MKLYAPKYYKDFVCIADRCGHSCCIGWEIDIDGVTMEKYKLLGGGCGYGSGIITSVEGGGIEKGVEGGDAPRFKLCEGDRCPHLNEKGLCRIILELGEGYLCDICREHPRFYNDNLRGREVGIGIACEEAARLVLTSDDYTEMIEIGEDDEVGICKGCGGEACSDFFDAVAERELVYAILSDKTLPYGDRLDRISQKYGVSPEILDGDGWRELFSSLEYLDEEHRADFAVFSLSPRVNSEIEVCLERALAYFIFRHCGEAEDLDDFASSLGLCLVLERLLASLAEKYGAQNAADLIIPARVVSEELEYSEENTESIKFEFAFG